MIHCGCCETDFRPGQDGVNACTSDIMSCSACCKRQRQGIHVQACQGAVHMLLCATSVCACNIHVAHATLCVHVTYM